MGSLLVKVPLGIERDGQYDWFEEFQNQPDAYLMSLHPVTAGANADDDVAATLAGVFPRASRLLGGYLCASANSGGVDANNTSAWVVSVGGSTYISKTNTANLVLDTPVALGTPVLTDCAAGAAVKLAITNGTNADLNSAVCFVTLALADANNFPAPGWGVVASNGGTVTISDGVKGIVALSPGATDNDEIYLYREVESLKFAALALVIEAKVQFTEANTDDANVMVGVVDAVAADTILDNGAGPKASYSGAVLFKVDGGTVWQFETSVAGTQTTTASTTTAGGASYQTLRIEYRPLSSTLAEAVPYVDGVQLRDSNGVNIKHCFTYTSATEMQFVAAVKDGGSNAETLNVDYVGGGQLR